MLCIQVFQHSLSKMTYEFKMKKIRIGFILFLVLSGTNAGIFDNISKEITKLTQPRSKSVKSVPLQTDLERNEDVKTEEEMDIALVTNQLGFVYCNIKQEPFLGRFVKEYLNMKIGTLNLIQTLFK